MKKNNRKGFTLAELLIVVAIIGVLVAISIPIFTAQLEKAREATDLANVRSAYAEAVANYLTDSQAATYNVTMRSTLTDCKTEGTTAGVNNEVILKGTNPCVIAVTADGAVTINGTAAATSTATTTTTNP